MRRTVNQLSMFGADTLADARTTIEQVKAGAAEAARCPCCDQFCKLYKQKLYSTMAAFLVKLVREHEKVRQASSQDQRSEIWIDVRSSEYFRDVTRNGNYAYLLHWGLVRQMENDDPKVRTTGMWQPTIRGIDFVNGRIRVSSHVYIFDNKVQSFEETQTTIQAALGKRFDYSELMEGTC